MRAKLKVGMVQEHFDWNDKTTKTMETLTMHAVHAGKYPDDGSDENNTFAKYSPQASLAITIANPALFGKFEVGQEFYVDFTLAE